MSRYAEDVIDKQNREIFFNIPLSKAIVLFSVLFYVLVALGSSAAYYFSMQKILKENAELQLKQTINTRQLMLNARVERETLLLQIFAEAPQVKAFFANPFDENLKKEYLDMFNEYKIFFQGNMLGWISLGDLHYHVNEQFMEKYDPSNAAHLWFFEALSQESPPIIRVDFDYLNRQIYDVYINYPIHSGNKAVGVISSRISLFEFVHNLDLPENIYVFGKNGTVIGAADEKIAKEKKTLQDLFGLIGSEVHRKSLALNDNASEMLTIGNKYFLISNAGTLDLLLVAEYEVNLKEIMKERASIVFLILLFIMLLIFIVFNKFVAYMLKPLNKNMQVYLESSLIDELTKLPNRRFFNIKMEDEWSRAVRGKYPVSFLMLDLDKFKSYNDKHGHAGGDSLLREVSRIFKEGINRGSDFVARIGGEEFCIFMPNSDAEGARKVAENIRIAVEKAGKITVSIGLISKAINLQDNMQDFIKIADQKLYEAKNTGRNKVVS